MRSIVLGLGFCAIAASHPVGTGRDHCKRTTGVRSTRNAALCHHRRQGNKKARSMASPASCPAADLRLWMTDAKAMTEKTKSTRKPEMKSYNLPKRGSRCPDRVYAVAEEVMTEKRRG